MPQIGAARDGLRAVLLKGSAHAALRALLSDAALAQLAEDLDALEVRPYLAPI